MGVRGGFFSLSLDIFCELYYNKSVNLVLFLPGYMVNGGHW